MERLRREDVQLRRDNKAPTRREVRRQQLTEAVTEEFAKSGGTYGSPKIWITLVRQGWRVSVNTIAKLMAELGLIARNVPPPARADPARETAGEPGLRAPRLHRRGAGPGVVRGHD
ncbi:IS3 family transposase [Streptomyces sp. XY332]|uniref:IS3 family transposase n=1 Tax=Streptomyces sp. XY332 TaxID=1415561 RepID=UPI000D148F43